jgi:hypothetical protein
MPVTFSTLVSTLLKLGMPVRDIATHYGCTSGIVRRWAAGTAMPHTELRNSMRFWFENEIAKLKAK